jgi:putative membrane protein
VSVILLKFLHIIAIAAWSGGLLCLPFLYLQRRRLGGNALHRLHNFTRFFYVSLVSPAAFLAIASGMLLIFLQATFEPWFSVKLALVAAMVIIHVMSGLVILRLFEPGQAYPWWRFVAVTGLTTGVIAAILVMVLGKPEWHAATWIAAFFAPGALGEMLGFSAWSR